MTRIHILKGTGDNCTCNDCSVLYGGDCWTTPYNDFLDMLELAVVNYLTLTPTGRTRIVSDGIMNKCIEEIVRPMVQKFSKVTRSQFYNQYYGFMPLLYLMTSEKKMARYWYRRSRLWLFLDFEKSVKESSKKLDDDV